MFSAESDIPPLCSPGGALVSDPAGKAELLSTWFDSKQSLDIVELPQTCHPRPAFCGIAFRAREVERYLLDLDPNGGVGPSGCFPMFFRKTASVLAPKLSCLFRKLLRGGEYPLERRLADVTPIPKGPLSALVCNYRPISITPVLSKVFKRLIALCFGRLLERSGVLPSHQYSYRKRLGTCDALLDIICAGQLELYRGGELALVQIDFSVAFDRVNHGGLVFKLREAGVGWLISRIFCPVVLRELRLIVCLVQVLMSYLVCHRVVFLVHCCFCYTLLTFQGCFRMNWLVMQTTLPCFVGHHILVIGHLWQHH